MTASKAVLISGAAKGIGRCLSRTFLEAGHRVFLLDIDADELEYTTTVHLKAHAKNLSSSVCNLREPSEIRETVKKAAEWFGGSIDLLVNNGGIAHPYWKDGVSMDSEDTLEQWNAYIETNLTAPFVASQAVIPYMKKTAEEVARSHTDAAGPSIIHIGSFRAHQSDPNQEGYASTKAGLLGLTQAMSITAQQWGIRVNLIAPGRIKVEHESKEGDEQGKEWKSGKEDIDQHAANRAGRAEDIAEAAMYLMNAGFVTGQDLTIDGGALKQKNKS